VGQERRTPRLARAARPRQAGVPYEIVKETPLLRSRRTAVIAGTGQSRLPAIQLDDGSWYRKESSEMAEEIRAGVLSDRTLGKAAL
jgi:hypothetical protein